MAEQQNQPRQGLEAIHRELVKTDDAGTLPSGAWVSRQDGRLYRAVQGHSVVAIQSKDLQEFERLADNPYESDDTCRIMSARVGVTPNF